MKKITKKIRLLDTEFDEEKIKKLFKKPKIRKKRKYYYDDYHNSARYQHVAWGHLPANLHLVQSYKEGAASKGR